MRRTILATVCVVMLCSNASGADDLKTLVEAAIAAEVKEFDAISERFEKDKLKPGESVMLFGKKPLSKKEKQAKLQEIREQVFAGEVTFRVLKGSARVGDCGRLFETGIKIRQVVGDDAFLGGWWDDFVESPPWLFRGVPGANKFVDGDGIRITMPMLVTGRYSYSTVGAGMKTTFVVEPLSVCVAKVAAAKKKAKK